MEKQNTTERKLTGKVITLVGRREPRQEYIEKALWRFVYSEIDQVAADLEIARRVYRAMPELVTAPEMPAHLRAIANSVALEAHGADEMAEIRSRVMADPVLADVVSRARQETMEDPAYARVVMEDARKLMRESITA